MELKWPGVLRGDGGHQLMAELSNVSRFGAVVGHDRHLLIDLTGGLQAERTLVVAGHVSIARIGELRTQRLRVGLRRQQKHNQPHELSCRRMIHVGCTGLENVMRHGVHLIFSNRAVRVRRIALSMATMI